MGLKKIKHVPKIKEIITVSQIFKKIDVLFFLFFKYSLKKYVQVIPTINIKVTI